MTKIEWIPSSDVMKKAKLIRKMKDEEKMSMRLISRQLGHTFQYCYALYRYLREGGEKYEQTNT